VMFRKPPQIVRFIFTGAATLVPANALAQTFAPAGNVSPTLDPSAPPAPPPAAEPAQAPAAAPKVYVIGPDGKVTDPGAAAPADGGYFIDSGQSTYAGDEIDVHTGPIPELHVVRNRDTLWDISYHYFASPWEWPKVWSYNPQITNPHWIYPGDLVRLLPRGMFSTAPSNAQQQDQAQQQPDLPAPARRTSVGLRQTAFVEKADLDKSITVVGGVEEKELLGNGDEIYLSYPQNNVPKVGQRYSIYEPGQKVKNHGTEYGSYVRILGELQVTQVIENKRAKAQITLTNREVRRGAKVGPLVKTFQNVSPTQPKVNAQAAIVGMLAKDQLIGDGEIVFLALGRSSGVEVGNRMFVVRRGDSYPAPMESNVGKDDRRYPARALGEIVVVDVGDKVSIGLVTLSVQEMALGDLVMMQAPRSDQ